MLVEKPVTIFVSVEGFGYQALERGSDSSIFGCMFQDSADVQVDIIYITIQVCKFADVLETFLVSGALIRYVCTSIIIDVMRVESKPRNPSCSLVL